MRRTWTVKHPTHGEKRDLSLSWALAYLRKWGVGAQISECR